MLQCFRVRKIKIDKTIIAYLYERLVTTPRPSPQSVKYFVGPHRPLSQATRNFIFDVNICQQQRAFTARTFL